MPKFWAFETTIFEYVEEGWAREEASVGVKQINLPSNGPMLFWPPSTQKVILNIIYLHMFTKSYRPMQLLLLNVRKCVQRFSNINTIELILCIMILKAVTLIIYCTIYDFKV